MGADYVKIYPGFFEGSLRDTPPYTRLLFLAMITKADVDGVVRGHPGFWAAYIGASEEQVRESLSILESPDPESQSPDEDGRRIIRWGEGANCWRIVNYKKYWKRSWNEDRAEYKRQWDRDHSETRHITGSKRPKPDKTRQDPTRPDQPETESEIEIEKNNPPKSPQGDDPSDRDALLVVARAIVQYFNQATGRNLGQKAQAPFVLARLRDGYTPGDLCMVIDYKHASWGDDERMREFVRPETLFRKSHFDQYLADAKAKASGGWNQVSKRDSILEQLRKEGLE